MISFKHVVAWLGILLFHLHINLFLFFLILVKYRLLLSDHGLVATQRRRHRVTKATPRVHILLDNCPILLILGQLLASQGNIIRMVRHGLQVRPQVIRIRPNQVRVNLCLDYLFSNIKLDVSAWHYRFVEDFVSIWVDCAEKHCLFFRENNRLLHNFICTLHHSIIREDFWGVFIFWNHF